LEPEIRRCVDEIPSFRIGRERRLELQARLYHLRVRPAEITKATGAIPLRETAACGGSQQFEIHSELNFRRSVAIDFAAEVHFVEIRARPGFWFHVILNPIQGVLSDHRLSLAIIILAPPKLWLYL